MSEEYENSLKYRQQRDVLISNTIRVLGFILLAIAFNRWWIVFFSALFMTYIDDEEIERR